MQCDKITAKIGENICNQKKKCNLFLMRWMFCCCFIFNIEDHFDLFCCGIWMWGLCVWVMLTSETTEECDCFRHFFCHDENVFSFLQGPNFCVSYNYDFPSLYLRINSLLTIEYLETSSIQEPFIETI